MRPPSRWLQQALDAPSWQEVHRRLQQEGRASKVDHPSAAQLRFEIVPPIVRRELKLK
jgi:hypothetical protein